MRQRHDVAATAARTRSSSTSGSAARRRHLEAVAAGRRSLDSGEGLAETGPSRARRRAHRGRRQGDGRRGPRSSARAHYRGRNRRPARRRNRDEVVAAIEAATGIQIPVISGEEESRLATWRCGPGSAWSTARWSCSTPAEGAPSSPSATATAWTSASASTSARSATRNASASPSRRPEALRRGARGHRRRPRRLDGRPPRPCSWDGRRRHEHDGGEARPGRLRPRPRAGRRARPSRVDRQIELYRTRDTEDRRAIVGLQPKRADVILAGACIVRTVMDKLGQAR